MKVRNFLSLFLLLLGATEVWATHNRAGEITYEQITQFFYKATITTYTKTSSPADRPELTLFWGDGTSSVLPRASIQDNFGGPDIRRNTYIGYHTYPGPSVYKMYFEDPNRNGGVINIPNSINVPFYVETQLIISAALGFNNSPVLLQPPIDKGVVGQVFTHNANAFDPDGDSLSYELIVCKSTGGLPIPGYFYPQASTSFALDPVTGDLVWDYPMICGEYNVAFLIKEWRNGFMIGFVERDMQIDILCNNPNNNAPPQFSSLNDFCVTAGDLISFTVTATDAPGTDITLTATGAPLQLLVSPAAFPQPTTGTGSVSQQFDWQTDCDHVRLQPYQMVFKAKDNDPFVNLVKLQTVRITIVAPAVQNLTTVPTGNAIQLNWNPNICTQALGYSIYRRNGFFGFIPGPCETGVPAYTGYVKIASVSGHANAAYLDNNNGSGLSPGTDYCYMIVADFPDGAESYASAEVCTFLKKDLPVITNVSVTATDVANGSMYIAWSRPSDLDLNQYPAPHEYRLLRANGTNGTSFTVVGSTFDLNDTIFNQNNLNTADIGHRYRVDLYATVNGSLQPVGSSAQASSIFLTIIPTDEKLILNWSVNVPWTNSYFTIFRYNGVSFDSIGFSNTNTFTDTTVENGISYCYYVKSTGDYVGTGFISPIINLSQEECAVPFDNVPPCTIGELAASSYDCILREITFAWPTPPDSCGSDIEKYLLWYAPTESGPFTLLDSIMNGTAVTSVYTDTPSVAGCYYLTAVDSNGNQSVQGNVLCFDNCPYYELPNVFTPDGDGKNDTFHPFPYRHVKDIDIRIYSRWGLEVFATTDADILWNGTSGNNGTELPEGTYYYICQVNEIYLSGIKSRVLKGHVQLIRSGGEKNAQ